MARTMKKFSAGGAQGRYDRRMADIEKDHAKAMARKTGKAAEVAEAKRQQRIADAKDDLAKRTGADRTATRAAEKLAESNLTKTRKYGAPKAVTKDELIAPGKMAESIGAITAPKSDLSSPASKPVQKPATVIRDTPKPSAADTARSKFFQDSLRTSDFKAVGDAANARQRAKIGASNVPSDQGFSSKSKVLGASTKTSTPTTTRGIGTGTNKGGVNSGRSPGFLAGMFSGSGNDAARAAKLATLKKAAEAPGASGFDKDRYKRAVSSGMYAKGGKIKAKEKIMKYAKGGSTSPSTPPKPSDADRARSKKRLDELKKLKPTAEEGKVVGSANRSEGPGYKKGGKAKGKPFAATKFGAAMKKKSADTKGRAMMKFAKGGSIDGCAVKGKTKASMVKMKNGGSC